MTTTAHPLAAGQPVWVLVAADNGATCITQAQVVSRLRSDRNADMQIAVQFVGRLRLRPSRTYPERFGYVTPRTSPTYDASNECIDCGCHLAEPHFPACPFTD